MKIDRNISFNIIKNTFGSFIKEKYVSGSFSKKYILYKLDSNTYGIMECKGKGDNNALKFDYKTDGLNDGTWIVDAKVSNNHF